MTRPDPEYAAWGWEPIRSSTDLVLVEICGRRPRVRPEAVPAAEAMNSVLVGADYENPCDWVGSWKYRVVAGTDQLSRHSYGLAVDLDYGGDTDGDGDPDIDSNPHLHRAVTDADWGVTFQLLEYQVRAVESIRTVSGVQVWRWLGWVNGDTMHFDIDCSPEDLASGIIIGNNDTGGDTMTLERWVTRLRPTDILQMGDVGILLPHEVQYWGDMLVAVKNGGDVDPEWQDLRDAVTVRSPIWVG